MVPFLGRFLCLRAEFMHWIPLLSFIWLLARAGRGTSSWVVSVCVASFPRGDAPTIQRPLLARPSSSSSSAGPLFPSFNHVTSRNHVRITTTTTATLLFTTLPPLTFFWHERAMPPKASFAQWAKVQFDVARSTLNITRSKRELGQDNNKRRCNFGAVMLYTYDDCPL